MTWRHRHLRRWPQLATVAALICASWINTAAIAADRADQTQNPTQPVTLRFVSWKADHPRAWDEAFARFAESHPHISIVRELAPHSSTAYHDLLTQKLKNRDATVDLFFMDIIWVPEFASAGWVLSLDDLFSLEEQEHFLPAAMETGRYDGHVYGVPSRIDSGMLFYRADLLAKYGFTPPRTWPELITQAEVITDGERRIQPALRGYSGQFKQYEGLVCSMMEFVGSYGGRLMTSDLQHSLLSTPTTLAAVEFVRDQIVGRITSRAVLTYQEPESVVPFIQGNAVFHRNWPYTWEVANDPRRSRVAGHVGVVPLPRMAADRPPTTALGGWLYAISPFSQHRREAWEFIRFISSAPLQRHFALAAGIAPSRAAVLQDEHVLGANPHFRAQLAMFRSATARPRTPLYPAISNILQRYFSRALAYRDVNLLAEAEQADVQIDRLLSLDRHNR
jgi:multiple sugar transport system substrate-binding protein